MRFSFASTVMVSCSCWLVAACTAATPPAQEPAPAVAGGSSSNTPPAGAGAGSTAGSSGGTSSGIAEIGGVGNAHEQMCGGIAGLRCPDKQYCVFAPEAHCGAADMSGTCARIPDVCPPLVDEVCGCNDRTYDNACRAAQAGVSIVAKGACATPDTTLEGGLCGTRGASRDCAAGLYCAFKSDCGSTDRGGVCSKKPSICTKIYKPVCGCDGKTYGNACTAAADGLSIVHDGPCKK